MVVEVEKAKGAGVFPLWRVGNWAVMVTALMRMLPLPLPLPLPHSHHSIVTVDQSINPSIHQSTIRPFDHSRARTGIAICSLIASIHHVYEHHTSSHLISPPLIANHSSPISHLPSPNANSHLPSPTPISHLPSFFPLATYRSSFPLFGISFVPSNSFPHKHHSQFPLSLEAHPVSSLHARTDEPRRRFPTLYRRWWSIRQVRPPAWPCRLYMSGSIRYHYLPHP